MSDKSPVVHYVTKLDWGVGHVGEGYLPESNEQLQEVSENLARFTSEINSQIRSSKSALSLPFTCMDDRDIIRTSSGDVDLSELLAMRFFQVAGGATLASTKALVAANASLVGRTKSFKEAFQIARKFLNEKQVVDYPHAGCGAAGLVKQSVAQPLDQSELIATIRALGDGYDELESDLAKLNTFKNQKLTDGYYDDWSSEWHSEFEKNAAPNRFLQLREMDDAVHGHHGSSIYFLAPGYVFDRTGYHEYSGRMSFGLTFEAIPLLAEIFATSPEEKRLIELAFRDDTLNVAKHIISAGMPVFK